MAKILSIAVLLVALSLSVAAQQTQAPFTIVTTSPPRGFLHREYRWQLQSEGGTSPVNWRVVEGELPPGLTLSIDGLLSGMPEQTGEFHFSVTATDSSRPANQKLQRYVLRIVVPLLLQWSRYPAVNGQRIECAIRLSNGTEQDFDLTVIVVAVNEIGRATAVGYQHFTLRKDTEEFEIPFSENLPRGSYEVNVDAVAEVAATNSIHRARLFTRERLQVLQGP